METKRLLSRFTIKARRWIHSQFQFNLITPKMISSTILIRSSMVAEHYPRRCLCQSKSTPLPKALSKRKSPSLTIQRSEAKTYKKNPEQTYVGTLSSTFATILRLSSPSSTMTNWHEKHQRDIPSNPFLEYSKRKHYRNWSYPFEDATLK